MSPSKQFDKMETHTPIAMIIILLLSIFIFSPFFIYSTNIDQFQTPLSEILKLSLIPVLCLFLLFIPIIRLISANNIHRISSMIAVLCLLVWFQGNVLLWNYGILDGRNIIWNDYVLRGWIDGFIWITSIILAYFYYSKIGALLIKGAVFILILQLLTMCYISFHDWELLHKKTKIESINNLNEIFEFSKNINILHIVSDGFQSDVFNMLLHDERFKDNYQESFRGFVFYNETLGVFPYTSFSIPAFLAGEAYSNEIPKNQYIDAILKNKTILSVAEKNQYEIDVISGDTFLVNRYSNLPFNNLYNLDSIKNINVTFYNAVLILDLGLFRISPHFLKKYIYNNQEWFLSQFLLHERIFNFNYFVHTHFLNHFSNTMNINREKSVYKYIHIMNTHNPMVVNEQCEFSGQSTIMNRLTLTLQSKCTLDTLSRLFDRMKAIGVYDNTLIILHGDHGGWVGNYRQGLPILFSTGMEAHKSMASLASPLLAIKRPNDNMNFRVSTIQASLLDLPATISDIMNWEANFNSESLEKIKPGENRKRFFHFFSYQKDALSKEYTGPIVEFSIEGSHYEVEWKSERVFFPPKQ